MRHFIPLESVRVYENRIPFYVIYQSQKSASKTVERLIPAGSQLCLTKSGRFITAHGHINVFRLGEGFRKKFKLKLVWENPEYKT